MTWGEFKEKINKEVADTDTLGYIEVFNFLFITVTKEDGDVVIEE